MTTDRNWSANELSKLIGAIYDCAINPDLWNGTLKSIANSLDCEKAIISLNDLHRNLALISQSVGWSEEWRKERDKHLPEINSVLTTWLVEERADDEPFVASWEFSPERFLQSKYAVNCLAPQNITDVAHFFLMRSPQNYSEVVLFKEAPYQCVSRLEIERGKLLFPHMKRAMTVSRMLDVQTLAGATFESVLDTLSVAVLVVAKDLQLVYANGTAESVLRTSDAIRVSGGKLKLSCSGAMAALTSAVCQSAVDESRIGRKGFGIPLRGRGDQIHLMNVLPLSPSSVRAELIPSAEAAIFISPAGNNSNSMSSAFKVLFGLSPAECSVLDKIAGGHTLTDAAAELGVKMATIKTHLQNIFDKTGVRRQSELVRLVASFSMPLRELSEEC